MNTNQSNSESRDKILRQIDIYIQNIQVLVALSSIFSSYKGKNFIGKKLESKDKLLVTPDLVTEFHDHDKGNYAIVSESKSSMPRDHERWNKDLKQLKK